MSNATPIDADEFVGLMKRAGVERPSADSPARCGVAVSGGADSMALALLVAAWGPARYVTFDHGLREGSGKEAEQVHDWLTARGLNHTILYWPGEKPTSNIQEAARLARYEALENWCMAQKLDMLLLAHHREDQAETFLLRLARGSGVDGLAAMETTAQPLTHQEGPRLLRPLLEMPRARLRSTLEVAGQGWIEDPSNEDVSYDRVRARALLDAPPLEGLNVDRLSATAGRMARVRSLLEELTERLLRESVEVSDLGFCRVDCAAIIEAHEEIALRVVSRILTSFGGGRFPPRLDSVERLLKDMQDDSYAGGTLAGCRIVPMERRDEILFGREYAAIGAHVPLNAGASACWDHRFQITWSGDGPILIGALGEEGWRDLTKLRPEVLDMHIPTAFRSTLPAAWQNESLLWVGGVGDLDTGHSRIKLQFAPRRSLFRNVS